MKEAMFYDLLDDGTVSCRLCPHRCKITLGSTGICKTRGNQNGILKAFNYLKAVAQNVDPIEKKPLYHFLPGTKIYSVAAFGCNFKCRFCQNWQISQVSKTDIFSSIKDTLPENIVNSAQREGCKSIAYTYTEPTVFFEYAYETAKLAKKQGLKNVFVTNGFITQEALEQIIPYLDAVNVDLKSFSEDFYIKNCNGRLKPVLETIKCLKENGVWVEVTTLVISEYNDSLNELKQIADFILSVGKEIPWHISRFHPSYHFAKHQPTSVEVLNDLLSQVKLSGLEYIYLGNTGNENNTFCPECGDLLIKRRGFDIAENSIKNNCCSSCGKFISGIFN